MTIRSEAYENILHGHNVGCLNIKMMNRIFKHVIHDVGNSILPLSLYTELLANKYQNSHDESGLEYIRAIGTGVNNAEKLLARYRHLLHESKISGEENKLTVTNIIRKAVDEAIPADALKRISLVADYGECSMHVHANPFDAKVAVCAVLHNALESILDEGTITVKLSKVTTQEMDSRAQITITDTGSGMSRDTLENCLQPFYTNKWLDHIGMGLTIAHSLIVQDGGNLVIASTPNKGTSVQITYSAADI